jgi:hypothetical protein
MITEWGSGAKITEKNEKGLERRRGEKSEREQSYIKCINLCIVPHFNELKRFSQLLFPLAKGEEGGAEESFPRAAKKLSRKLLKVHKKIFSS